jgi:RNA polymerase-binding transcription factor
MEQMRGGAAAKSTHRGHAPTPRTRNEEQLPERLELTRRSLLELSRRVRERPAAEDQPRVSSPEVTLSEGDSSDQAQLARDGEAGDAMLRLLSQNGEQIDRALVRLQEGSYGYCEDCGAPIPAERLDIRPEATRCVSCQAARDRTRRGAGHA